MIHQLQRFYLNPCGCPLMSYYLGGNFDLNGVDVNTSTLRSIYHPTCHPQQHDSCKLVATWQYEIRYSSTSLSLMAEVFFGGNNTIISLPHIYGDHTSFEVQCLFITMCSEAVEFPTQASLVKCTVIKLTSNCAGVL